MDDIKTVVFKVSLFGSNHKKRLNLIRRSKIDLRISLIQIIPLFYKNFINATYRQRYEALLIIIKTIPRYIFYSIANEVFFKFNINAEESKSNFSKSSSYRLENKKTAVVYIGDSHAEFWSRIHKKNINESIYGFHLGAVLANTFSNNFEKLQTVAEFLKRFQSLHNFDQLIIVLVFGEIDIRAHSYAQIYLYDRYRDETGYAYDIAEKYARAAKYLKSKLIFEFKEKVNIEIVIRRQVPPSNNHFEVPKTQSDYKRLLGDNNSPNIGSIEKCIIADQELAKQISEQCKKQKVLFQTLPKRFLTKMVNSIKTYQRICAILLIWQRY